MTCCDIVCQREAGRAVVVGVPHEWVWHSPFEDFGHLGVDEDGNLCLDGKPAVLLAAFSTFGILVLEIIQLVRDW